MSADGTEITSDKGITIVSSDPITAAEREYLTPKTAKPIPPDAKPGVAKEAKAVTVEAVDDRGREHGADGKYKGNGKPAEEPDGEDGGKTAEVAKPDEKEAVEGKKRDAQTRIRDLAEKKNAAEARAAAAERRAATAEARAEARAARAAAETRAEPEPKSEPERDTTRKPQLADFGPVDEVDTWAKYQAAHDDWLLGEAERKIEAREQAKVQEQQWKQHAEKMHKAVEEGDAAIKAAGGEEFLARVPVMARLVPSTEVDRLGLQRSALTGLADFVLGSGKRLAEVAEYLQANEEIVDRFEAIGDLPVSRQPLIFERELGMLVGTLRATLGSKASVAADNPEPGRVAFKPRANPPVQSVTGSPHIAEPDLSNIEDFDKYMAAKGHRPRR